MISKSLWHINSSESEIRSEDLATSIDPGQLLIQTKYSMISTGTEYSVSSGLVPFEFSKNMSVPYMAGSFALPIKYGYACCGASGDGNIFHFMHPHQNLCFIQKKDLFKIEDLPSHKVPLISNMETVLNAIWDADLLGSESVGIIGYGNIGSLLAETLEKMLNIKAVAIERDDWRSEMAVKNGFDIDQRLQLNYDVIFNTTASSSAMNKALTQLNEEGKLVELSWYADKEVALKLGRHFHYNRLKIISSQVSKIPIKKRDHMTYEKRKRLALDYLKDDRYNKLITDIIDFDDAPSFFEDLRSKKLNKGLIYLFKY